MRVGTKSLLFGVHQFIWHPLTVLLAWRQLYKRWPTPREAICILIHDFGYWSLPNMDDEEGSRHPEWAYRFVLYRLRWGVNWAMFCLLHSRHYARGFGSEPSLLCWADKLSILFDPPWFYLFRARLSGELAEYRQCAAYAGVVPLSATDSEWLAVVRERFRRIAHSRRGDVVSYVNPSARGKP